MYLTLRNPSGVNVRINSAHWSVFLVLAEGYGWKPERTQRPAQLAADQEWDGDYVTGAGQMVSATDARSLANVLHVAAVHPKLKSALIYVISKIQAQLAKDGIPAAEQVKLTPDDFTEKFRPLSLFLNDGAFFIDAYQPAVAEKTASA